MTKEYLQETAREYIEKYPVRLNNFMNEFEADESDFVKREIEYFESTIYDIKNSESSHDGFSTTGYSNFIMAYDLINEIGYEKFKYSTEKKIRFLESKLKFPSQQTETQTEHVTVEIKPVFNPETVQIVFDILKDFFSVEHQKEFKKVIETGNKASYKILFKGNGNRLNDTFKQLFEHNFITGCQKQDLINWIISNFTFIHQNKVKEFVYDTVEKTISRNNNPCKSPLIEIKNGQIQRVLQPRIKKYNKY